MVTDPGSPLEQTAREAGYSVFHADPNVGGRYSALTAFGLVPSALAGADVAELLDEAEDELPALGENDDNPGLVLGAAIGAAAAAGRDKLVLDDSGSHIIGLPDWIEQLVAESTGKEGKGILPVVVGTDPTPPADDLQIVIVAGECDAEGEVRWSTGRSARSSWCGSTPRRSPGRMLGINPFDQPERRRQDEHRAHPDGGGPTARCPRVHRGASRSAVTRLPSTHGPAGVFAALLADSPSGVTSRSRPTSTGSTCPSSRRRSRRLVAADDRPAGHLRMGPPLPALDRAVPQGRDRRTACSCRSPAR